MKESYINVCFVLLNYLSIKNYHTPLYVRVTMNNESD